MKKLMVMVAFGLLMAGSLAAADLYKVTLHSQHEAETLKSSEVDVLFWVRGGYLVLADIGQSHSLKQAGLDMELLASDVRRDQLAMDGRFDRKNAEMFEVLYEDGRVRLLLAGAGRLALTDEPTEVFPLPDTDVKIFYYPPAPAKRPHLSVAAMEDIEQLIDLVSQDSLESYLLRLQAFDTRLTGTYPSYLARDWIADKFDEFGYDSVEIDPFIGSQVWNYTPCQSYNVIAYKVGNLYPERQIIIGGHFDAVPDCPGADDNASGTACVLEIARILKDIETDMTIILIAFDSEESWMWGSYHYCDAAVERNDDIVLMINPDMIAHEDNDTRADLYYGPETAYASLWSQLASTHVGIIGDLSGSTASDHWPFQQAGYDVIFVQEKTFSTNYHQPSDSSVYLNLDYMTRMVKATLATLYTVAQHPPPMRIEAILEPGDGQSQIVTWQ
ncbi:MAG: M28 family peptidase, partial [Candidatus Zixiibacteriota bacterium]